MFMYSFETLLSLLLRVFPNIQRGSCESEERGSLANAGLPSVESNCEGLSALNKESVSSQSQHVHPSTATATATATQGDLMDLVHFIIFVVDKFQVGISYYTLSENLYDV